MMKNSEDFFNMKEGTVGNGYFCAAAPDGGSFLLEEIGDILGKTRGVLVRSTE